MTSAAIIGGGITPFGRTTATVPQMAFDAVTSALSQAELTVAQIDAVFCGHALPGSGGGTAVMAEIGLDGVPVFNVAAACASSAVATSLAATHIEHGTFGRVLVVGFEAMGRGMIPSSIVHDEFGRLAGLDLQPPRYALKAQAYLDAYGVSIEHLAAIAVKARRNAALNPNAHWRKAVTLEEVIGSPLVASPLTRLQCCPSSSGVAALVLAPYAAPGGSGRPVRIAASAVGSERYGESADAGLTEEVTVRLARQAYERAALAPADIGVAQLHDAFTSGEAIRSEALGLCPVGSGATWASEGRTSIGGSIPINTDGGLLGRGHPLGATGAAQLLEIYRQLTGTAAGRQIEPVPRAAISQNSGGSENAATVVTICTA